MENHADRVSSTRPAMESANMKTNHAFKPGRKFGLTGQRQQQQVNSFATAADGRRMSAHREEQRNNWMYSLSEQEMEDRYNAICLAIRTENMTLGQRLEHQHAERDLVENNLNQEVRVLHSLFLVSRGVTAYFTTDYRPHLFFIHTSSVAQERKSHIYLHKCALCVKDVEKKS